jgi:hypothetical protein
MNFISMAAENIYIRSECNGTMKGIIMVINYGDILLLLLSLPHDASRR